MLPIGYGNMAKGDFHFACLTLKMWVFPLVISNYRETFDMAGLSQWKLWSVLCPPLQDSSPSQCSNTVCLTDAAGCPTLRVS